MSAWRLAHALVLAGARVTVVAPSSTEDAVARHRQEEGIEVLRLAADDRWSLPRRLQPWRDRVRTVIGGSGADIVHGQGLIAGGLGAADARGMPRIVTAHGNPAADTRAAYRGPGALVRAAIRDALARSVVRDVDAVVGVHPDWRLNIPCEPRRFVHIPNPLDDSCFSTKRQRIPGLVVFAGGARSIKGSDLLAAAWPGVRRLAPHAALVVAGWPNGVPSPFAPERGLGPVRVHGQLSPPELAALLAEASALVVPSRFEVAPLLIAEAWAAGTPVVASAVGGIPALAQGAATLVDASSAAKLAAAIARALAHDDGVASFAAEGRRRAESYRADAVAEAHLALYRELLGATS